MRGGVHLPLERESGLVLLPAKDTSLGTPWQSFPPHPASFSTLKTGSLREALVAPPVLSQTTLSSHLSSRQIRATDGQGQGDRYGRT